MTNEQKIISKIPTKVVSSKPTSFYWELGENRKFVLKDGSSIILKRVSKNKVELVRATQQESTVSILLGEKPLSETALDSIKKQKIGYMEGVNRLGSKKLIVKIL